MKFFYETNILRHRIDITLFSTNLEIFEAIQIKIQSPSGLFENPWVEYLIDR